jgi:hypothetical protein
LFIRFAQFKAKETMMQTHFRHAAIALALVAGTGTADAQTYYTRDAVDRTIINGQPLQLTPAQRTTIYRTIVPQGRGRAPIVRERIVMEPVAPVPPVRERIVTQSLDDYAYGDYAYDNRNDYDYRGDYAYAPAPRRVVTPRANAYGDYAYAVGARVPATARLAPIPQAVVAEVPIVQPYRYMVFNGRVLLIDPVTSTVVADVTGY